MSQRNYDRHRDSNPAGDPAGAVTLSGQSATPDSIASQAPRDDPTAGVRPDSPVPEPDGPFEPDGFWYHGAEVRFGRAEKQEALVLALWDNPGRRPRPPRKAEDVLKEVYGDDRDKSDAAFRQLCTDTQKRFDAAQLPLRIKTRRGKIWLEARPV